MHQLVFIAINLVMKEKIGEKMLKHYVRILFSNPPRIKDEEVQERNKDTIDFPEGALAYVFYDRNEVIAEDGELLIGEKKNISYNLKPLKFAKKRRKTQIFYFLKVIS